MNFYFKDLGGNDYDFGFDFIVYVCFCKLGYGYKVFRFGIFWVKESIVKVQFYYFYLEQMGQGS